MESKQQCISRAKWKAIASETFTNAKAPTPLPAVLVGTVATEDFDGKSIQRFSFARHSNCERGFGNYFWYSGKKRVLFSLRIRCRIVHLQDLSG